MRIKEIGPILLFIGAGLFFVVSQIDTLSERGRVADARAAALAIYQTQVNAYNQATAAYLLCLDSVARSDTNRAQWEDLASIIAALPDGAPYADRIRQGPLLSSPPRLPEDCSSPGVLPDPPG